MNTLSKELVASSNKIQSLILQRLAEVSQVHVALDLGVREDVISKFKADKLEFACQFIASLGLKVVTESTFTANYEMVRATELMALEYLKAKTAHDNEKDRIIESLKNENKKATNGN